MDHPHPAHIWFSASCSPRSSVNKAPWAPTGTLQKQWLLGYEGTSTADLHHSWYLPVSHHDSRVVLLLPKVCKGIVLHLTLGSIGTTFPWCLAKQLTCLWEWFCLPLEPTVLARLTAFAFSRRSNFHPDISVSHIWTSYQNLLFLRRARPLTSTRPIPWVFFRTSMATGWHPLLPAG